jgi:hypothetical protein
MNRAKWIKLNKSRYTQWDSMERKAILWGSQKKGLALPGGQLQKS